MTDREAFIAAIIADPADDTARLVFADWLEDRCDPPEPERAEFIRVQVELAHNPHCIEMHNQTNYLPTCPVIGWATDKWCRSCELRRRERELLDKNHATDLAYNRTAWALPIRGDWSVDFTRGFASCITCSWSDWLAHADTILREQPVERVKLTTYPDCQHRGSQVALPFSHHWIEQVSRNGRVPVIELLETHWPRIAFELPPVERRMDMAEYLRQRGLAGNAPPLRDLLAAESL